MWCFVTHMRFFHCQLIVLQFPSPLTSFPERFGVSREITERFKFTVHKFLHHPSEIMALARLRRSAKHPFFLRPTVMSLVLFVGLHPSENTVISHLRLHFR